MTSPPLVRPLASYPNREEFQVDRTLVWVEMNSSANRDAAVTKANQLFPAVWSSVPEIIAAAEASSRADMPSFWIAHDAAGTSHHQLSVLGIWIDPETEVARYDVGLNLYDPPGGIDLPHLSEETCILVTKSAEGRCTAQIVQDRRTLLYGRESDCN